jgi:hypothetical protein
MFKTIFKVAAVGLVVLIIAAVLTNPTREDFAAKIRSELDKEVSDQTNNPALNYIAEIGLEFTKQLAEKMVERENCFICSIFVVELPDGKYSYLGAFGQFFPLQEKNPLDQIRKIN